MSDTTCPTAAELNAHLSAGGRVQVTTYTRSTVYDSRHVGFFTQGAKTGALYVAHGRSRNCLTIAGRLIVGIRLI